MEPSEWSDLIATALREDLGTDSIRPAADITAAWTTPPLLRAGAMIHSRARGVIAGLPNARQVFVLLDAAVEFQALTQDGSSVNAGQDIARLSGPALALLAGERTALNLLQRLSGIATLTRRFADAVAGTGARITDTRKTTPGMRVLEKYAVRMGGGVNHRMGLYDAALIKENHAACAGGVDAAVRRVRRAAAAEGRQVPVYAEAESLDDVHRLLEAAPDRIMLDNMPLETVRKAVALIRASMPRVEIEATGGINLDNVRGIAETGVDLISIGALTHSAPALDLSMLFDMSPAEYQQ